MGGEGKGRELNTLSTSSGMANSTTAASNGGLSISQTEPVLSFLTTASSDPRLSPNLRQLASSLLSLSSVPYKSLRSLWSASDSSTRPDLLPLFSGSQFILISPKPREKSEELQSRLRKLAEVTERKEYQELVKDITPRKVDDEPFSSYKDQFGFGLHVVLIMFTGYLVGYAAFRALFGQSPVLNAVGGIFGLVCGMLVETVLFIIRTTNQDRKRPTMITSKGTLMTSNLKKNQ